MYAIVDIETTGGSPENSGITEIAAILHDGKQVVKRFSTLINPGHAIPYYITRVTGITNEMVEDAPAFHEIAKEFLEFTTGAVFVAHNVNFDYSFIKGAYKSLGYAYQRKTLCTVRMGRAAFPGLPSYSLGNLCKSLKIEIRDRHRAMGDAEATAILFGKIIDKIGLPDPLHNKAAGIALSKLPPLLPEAVVNKLPVQTTGVYYFHNQAGEVLYVGKSKDIRKRIYQHFTKIDSKKTIQLHEQIADITYENTGNELVALLLESEEIKRLKPLYNAAQKRTKALPSFGVFYQEDVDGYLCFQARPMKEGDEPIKTADNLQAIRNIIYDMVERHQLCLSKCDLYNLGGPCFDYQLHKCKGACIGAEPPKQYNARARQAFENTGLQKESFFVSGNGRHAMEKTLVLIENGIYKGFGFVDISETSLGLEEMRAVIKKASHNADIERILQLYIKKGFTKIAIPKGSPL